MNYVLECESKVYAWDDATVKQIWKNNNDFLALLDSQH